MTGSFPTLRVNSGLMLDTFIQLILIGATGGGSVSRVAFGEAASRCVQMVYCTRL
ncbi:MAG: hypothetical protein HY863_15335 [Chloroflexi bacterium]|nr:hypothetical protein [Chloroflexota bacterium]